MQEEPKRKTGGWAALWLPWCLLLLLFWFLLVEGRLDSLWFAGPVLFLAYLARRALPLPLSLRRIDLVEAALFAPRFVWGSVAAGADVAWRALAPGLPIRPVFVHYPLRLRSAGSRVFLSHVLSLMPGTLTCEVGEDALVVHALSGTEEKIVAATAKLETRVAAIFREKIEEEA